ncbi:MAG: pyruvate dehydrogenase (acetyl-transferring), homodimeric type [Opitutales bacterium]
MSRAAAMSEDPHAHTPDNTWMALMESALKDLLETVPPEAVETFLLRLRDGLQDRGLDIPDVVATPYQNTIPAEDEPVYPGDIALEQRIEALVRWNAMAMVVKANQAKPGIGGHISTFASSATLYEVGLNHFFHGGGEDRPPDCVYFQGHASPGNYARAYLEGRMDARLLHHFRQELAEGGGLSSYPHPYLMPDFWQFPTVSMGLGPVLSVYQAHLHRYLNKRGLLEKEPRIWAFVGDGETDEPETLGSIGIASREQLNRLIWVIDCNLQRLDGPVRGNHRIIQELERRFRGAGWHVIKVIWGSGWDALLAKDSSGELRRRMETAVDGDFQKYATMPGSYMRDHFFGTSPELRALVDDLTDDDLLTLQRGGHDRQKIYAAFRAATESEDRPTVILAKTIKGYGLGETIQASNVTHQQKKLNEKELRRFRERLEIPIDEDAVAEKPFYRPPDDSAEARYLQEKRTALGGYLPRREPVQEALELPGFQYFETFYRGSDKPASTTSVLVRILSELLKNREIGARIVPIIPDEARTFGMDALFRQVGIYASTGQRYDPVDSGHLLYYRESETGQILEEGITEAGSLSSFIAAGTAHATLGRSFIPFFLFYSMFGFQRVGDLAWAAGDARARGFLIGATAGRTTLNGEGLQHQDGQSHLMASAVPNLLAFDPAFAYEMAVIIQNGLERMYGDHEDIFYYITAYNEAYPMPEMPEGVRDGILKGLYRFSGGNRQGGRKRAHLFGSGSIMPNVLKARDLLESDYKLSVDAWSAPSYKSLRVDCLEAERWNRLHPEAKPRRSYLETLMDGETGPVVAATDYVRLVPDQIAPWMPGRYVTLGTDGFGRSDTRETLRTFFEISPEHIAYATLKALFDDGSIDKKQLAEARDRWAIDPDKPFPALAR